MTREEFFDKCRTHDWTFEYSDDHRVWKAGWRYQTQLLNEISIHPEYEEIYNAWRRFIFNGGDKPFLLVGRA